MDISNKLHTAAGELLRSKREELNISVADIAKQLHLEAKVITALEQDDYDKLPGAVYVRGYIRAYAKAVGIEGESVIDLFDSEVSERPPEILMKKKHHARTSNNDKLVRAFTYIISLILVILVLIWYRSHYVISANTPINSAAENEEPKSISKPAFDYEFSVVTHSSGWQNVVEREDSKTNVVTVEEAYFNENKIGLLSLGPDKLKLLVSENSWIEISDSTGEKLFWGMGKTGQIITLSGNAPFEILFGYAPGIKLFYKDQLFNTKPYLGTNGVARFSLDD